MAANYEQFKKAWDMMDDTQRKQQTELYKDNQQFQQFAQQYSNEKNNSSTTGTVNNTTWTNNSSNSNNQNGSTWSYDPIYYRENNSNQNQWGSTLSDWRNWDGNFYWKTSFDKEETFDKSMIWEANWIKIQEWTGKETWRPDYKEDSEARLNEMRNNLNQYYQTNPEWFQDREVFNRQFEYNERESDAQRAVLDSYWKKAQDSRTASSYTNPNMVTNAFNSWDLTPWVLDAIKYNNPDLYAQWQKAMQDDLNARIANYAVPRTATETADIWMELVKKLWLEQGDPYQIYDNWVSRCEELGVFNMNKQLSSYISEMEQVKGERTAAMQRVMTQWAWRKSQALIDAQVAKTSSLYDARFADLQNMYQATYNQRQQNLAIANQSAQMLQAQAAEDQRIFQNKITALWFAMKVDDYRTPEQQLQNQLRFNAISNDLQLLNKAKSNDLELYNKYATAKLQNQLEAELTNLDVADPLQQRANLNRVVGQYFEQFWDIIQRSQSQVVDDVLAYAKEHWVGVGQALSENFIKPLQSKTEYQNALKAKYPSPQSESDKWSYTVDEEWNIKVQYTWSSQLDLEAIRAMWGSGTWKMRTERNNNPTAMTSDVARSLWWVEWEDYIVWDAFQDNPNLHTAYLLGDPIETTIRLLDRAATTGRWAFYTKGWKQRWTHTAMSDEAWLNLSAEEKKNVVLKMLHNEWGDISKMAYYNWQGQWGNLGNITIRDGTTYDSSNAPTYNSLSYDQQNTVKWLLNLSINPTTITKRQYWDDFEKILTAAQELNPNWSAADYWQADKAKKEWNTSSKNGSNSRNATAAATAKEIYDMADSIWNTTFKDWNALMNFLKNRTSEEDYLKLQVNMQTMASEFAWALKGWNAAPTTEEINDAKDLLAASFSKWGMKASAIQIIKQLYNKNVTEADNYRAVTLEKPNPIWIGEMPEFMETVVWLNLSDYYNYKWVKEQYWWGAASWTNNVEYTDFITYMNN